MQFSSPHRDDACGIARPITVIRQSLELHSNSRNIPFEIEVKNSKTNRQAKKLYLPYNSKTVP